MKAVFHVPITFALKFRFVNISSSCLLEIKVHECNMQVSKVQMWFAIAFIWNVFHASQSRCTVLV